MFWFSKQDFCIKWCIETSTCFTISIRVRQVDILSPMLFVFTWMIFLLSESGIGCQIDDLCIHHVFYVFDLCLMVPCAIALQKLISLCYEYSVEIDLNFNATKSYCVAFTPKLYKLALLSLHRTICLSHIQTLYNILDKYVVVTTMIMQKC